MQKHFSIFMAWALPVGVSIALLLSLLPNTTTAIVTYPVSANLQTGDVTSAIIADGTIVNADINAAAAIAYSKLALATSIVNADIASGAAIAYSKLALTGAILNADLAGSITAAKLVGSDIATVGTITSGVWNGTTIAVANGGTSSTSLTAHNVLTGNGTSALNSVAPGSSGNVLTSNGTDWTSAANGAPTSTQGVSNGPTGTGSATQTQTITHGLGRAPIRIDMEVRSGLAGDSSSGTYAGGGQGMVYDLGASAVSSSSASGRCDITSHNATGVIGNITSTTFDVVWSLDAFSQDYSACKWHWVTQ